VPRACTVCTHDERHAIDVALVAREPYRDIARRYGVSKDALSRHTKVHIPEYLAKAKKAIEVAEADSLLDRVEGLYRRTEAILDTVEANEEWPTALAAIRECRHTLSLLGEVAQELSRTPTFNLTLSPEYIEMRTILVSTLEHYPEARLAVADALASVEAGHDGG
jgi:hypothetical protein